MSIPIDQVDFSALTPSERVLLAERLWESVMDQSSSFQLTPAQESEIDARLDAMDAGKMPVSDWDVVRARLLTKKQ